MCQHSQAIAQSSRTQKSEVGSPARVMVYSKKKYLVREQDAPTILVTNI
ncbi:MAG: hypothetical protein F6K22_16760 [Okeania sp. SIO2F4]|nr:hypothetical protein [Okeania sp. SIO2F4]NES04334.1 hypothetical protein [Okeania sp. SIO2F4]